MGAERVSRVVKRVSRVVMRESRVVNRLYEGNNVKRVSRVVKRVQSWLKHMSRSGQEGVKGVANGCE